MTKKRLTYKSSGVNIDKADDFVRGIQGDVARTMTPNVLHRMGAFGSLFTLPKGYDKPVLVSSTDGVGTKLLIAQAAGRHDTVGIDLVAMNVNDVLCAGAKPLYFLDYIACGKVDPKILKQVVKGIADGCAQAGCSLVGGETAEMPGLYGPDEYDLAGFTVGIVDEDRIIDGSRIAVGDVMIGLPSSGLHSNGYSLVRKVFSVTEQKKRAKELLTPTRIYVQDVLPILDRFSIKGIAHVTGGAFFDKLTKILPIGKCFSVRRGSWPVPKIFEEIQKRGNVQDNEMFRTFNMGIGLVMVVSIEEAEKLRNYLNQQKIEHYQIGIVVEDSKKRLIL